MWHTRSSNSWTAIFPPFEDSNACLWLVKSIVHYFFENKVCFFCVIFFSKIPFEHHFLSERRTNLTFLIFWKFDMINLLSTMNHEQTESSNYTDHESLSVWENAPNIWKSNNTNLLRTMLFILSKFWIRNRHNKIIM